MKHFKDLKEGDIYKLTNKVYGADKTSLGPEKPTCGWTEQMERSYYFHFIR